ncbi:MAG: TAXI family TRAP transporter solute-binding subunit [Pseudomonadota bacterium]
MKTIRFTLFAASIALATTATSISAETLRAEGGSAAGLAALVPQLLSKYTAADHEIRVNVDQTLTRSALKVATGAIDLASVPAGAFAKMTTGTGPYRQMSDEAIAASGEIRSLFSFIGGHYHPMTYVDSGIEAWDDIKGKRVFVGPPAGSAAAQSMALIEAITGYKPDEDYEAIRLAWGAANQSFEDGKFDLFMRSGTMGSAAIDQFGSATQFRLLGIPEETLETDGWATYVQTPGYAADVMPAGTYDNQSNGDEDILVSAYVMFMAVNQEMDEQTAYDLTKAMFENLDDAHSVNQGLTPLTLDNAFVSLAAPLHPGAIRYYEEQGVEIPANLRPGS